MNAPHKYAWFIKVIWSENCDYYIIYVFPFFSVHCLRCDHLLFLSCPIPHTLWELPTSIPETGVVLILKCDCPFSRVSTWAKLFELILEITLGLGGISFRNSRNLYLRRWPCSYMYVSLQFELHCLFLYEHFICLRSKRKTISPHLEQSVGACVWHPSGPLTP